MRVVWKIEQLPIAAARAVEDAVKALRGVDLACVDAADDTLRVDYNPKLVTATAVQKRARRAGCAVVAVLSDEGVLAAEALWHRLFLSLMGVVPLFVAVTLPRLVVLPSAVEGFVQSGLYGLLQLVLTVFVLVVNHEILANGWLRLFGKTPCADSLPAVGVSVGFVYSFCKWVNVLDGAAYTHYYFETPAMLLVLVLLAKLLLNAVVRRVDGEGLQVEQTPMAQSVARFSRWLVPSVLGVAAVSGGLWWWLSGSAWAAVRVFVCVTVAGCPCALGLTVFMALAAGVRQAARRGLFFRNAEALEKTRKLRAVAITLRGILTKEQLLVTAVVPAWGWSEEPLLALAASAERMSEHPIARAIVAEARERALQAEPIEEFVPLHGKGLRCVWREKVVVVGSRRLLEEHGLLTQPLTEAAEPLLLAGLSVVYVSVGGQPAGVLALADALRESAVEAVEALRQSRIGVSVLTADAAQTAQALVGETVAINEVLGDLSVQGKAEAVARRQQADGLTAMVGDSARDAEALAQADLAVVVAAQEVELSSAADLVLAQNDLRGIGLATALSETAVQKAYQGFRWIYVYHAVALPLACGGLTALFGVPLVDPLLAAAASGLFAVAPLLNALRPLAEVEDVAAVDDTTVGDGEIIVSNEEVDVEPVSAEAVEDEETQATE